MDVGLSENNNKMKYNIILMVSMIFLLGILPVVSAEISLWNDIIINQDDNSTSHVAYYQLDDTSTGFKFRTKDVPITITFFTQDLPFNLTFGQVDFCNFSFTSFHNLYDAEGNFIGDELETGSFFFNSGINQGSVTINLKDDDDISAKFLCHYTDNRSLFEGNAIIGRISTNLPSFECKGCEEFTLEELSNEIERTEETTVSELSIYRKIQTLIDRNFQLWLIASFIVKIFFIVFAVGLIFASVYYMWKFFQDILGRI